ncbi:hypothetical protein FisN_3Hu620 [Fistulifera solaris]|uniref:START domain-containing protein n=1 Tax=Fistulifera solaris TaxID=1519565 RepID=A0A1Z5K383_FISSO|nr:hypothetical protein FisN_3Hu620 [Fistulifera solaris]|eukprot:GAX20531.1 hypothetical protein FisN_3Hu620 [Fistulifera solaris]
MAELLDVEDDIVLEGEMLKKSRNWLEPYIPRRFVLHSDNSLRYYSITNGKLKGIIDLSNCEVSELFVSKHKDLIYCLRITSFEVEDDGGDDSSVELELTPSFEGSFDLSPKSPRNRRRRSAKLDNELFVQDGHNRSKSQRSFRVEGPTGIDPQQQAQEEELLRDYRTNKKMRIRRSRKRIWQGTKIAAAAGGTAAIAVATAGLGLVAGLVFVGAAAAGGGSAAVGLGESVTGEKKKEIMIASSEYEMANTWRKCIIASQESLCVQQSTWGQLFATDGRKARNALLQTAKPPSRRDQAWSQQNQYAWRLLHGGWSSTFSGISALRIYREERIEVEQKFRSCFRSSISLDGKACAPIKSHEVLSTSAVDAFLCLMSVGCVASFDHKQLLENQSEYLLTFRIVEAVDDNTDIIHMVLSPLFLFPSWTAPRDFCLYRYWRLEEDGSYVVCYESVEHSDCPPEDFFVRAEMHKVFTIAPHKRTSTSRRSVPRPNECLVTAFVQVDPRGWVPTTPLPMLSWQSYAEAFGVAVLSQLVNIRDAIDTDRFVPCARDEPAAMLSFHPSSQHGIAQARSDDLDEGDEAHDDLQNYDFTFSTHEYPSASKFAGLASTPMPLTRDSWAEPDSNSFRVRGKHYKDDGQKINAGPSIGRLIAVDLVSVDQPLYSGFCVHPRERVQLALAMEAEVKSKGHKSDMPPFVFVVNIVIPGPPYYHGVFYYAIDDMRLINGEDGTPSSKLCNEFFFGTSDEFRNRTFKLVPQIVQGNFLVRKAVGSTPAVLGKKLRQLYVQSDRFFEVIIDCASNPVATGVVRLALGYAKTLVVDMGFLFEGNDESTLPERIFGSVRLKNPDFSPKMRHVTQN